MAIVNFLIQMEIRKGIEIDENLQIVSMRERRRCGEIGVRVGVEGWGEDGVERGREIGERKGKCVEVGFCQTEEPIKAPIEV